MPLSPDNVIQVLWASDQTPEYPSDGSPPECDGWWPPIGGLRFTILTVPPSGSSVDFSPEPVAQTRQLMPGFLETMDPKSPGFHTSDTTDLFYILSGRYVLQLDDGVEVELRAGDTVIQNGTRHAFRNPAEEPCVLVAFSIGGYRIPHRNK